MNQRHWSLVGHQFLNSKRVSLFLLCGLYIFEDAESHNIHDTLSMVHTEWEQASSHLATGEKGGGQDKPGKECYYSGKLTRHYTTTNRNAPVASLWDLGFLWDELFEFRCEHSIQFNPSFQTHIALSKSSIVTLYTINSYIGNNYTSRYEKYNFHPIN